MHTPTRPPRVTVPMSSPPSDPTGPVLVTVEDAPEPFEEFFAREIRSVTGLAYSLTGSMADAEELAQVAFTDAFRDWDRIGRLERPGAWVRRAVANRAVSRRRRLGTEARAVVRLAARPNGSSGDQPEITSASNQLFALIRNLPARQAQVVALHYWEQCSVAEIAETLGISTGTVKTCLHRGRATLAERLRADTEPHHTSASGAQP